MGKLLYGTKRFIKRLPFTHLETLGGGGGGVKIFGTLLSAVNLKHFIQEKLDYGQKILLLNVLSVIITKLLIQNLLYCNIGL